MYRYSLALRWLLSRPINLLGVAGVMLGVWALIVVVSIFSGYIREVRTHIRAASSDLSVLRIPPDARYAELEAKILEHPNVRACAPRMVWYGLVHGRGGAAGKRPGRSRLPGADSPFVNLLGIDPQREALVSEFGAWLRAVTDELRVADLDAPLSTGSEAEAPLLIGQSRLGERRPGTRVEVTTARLEATGQGGEQLRFTRRQPFRIAGAFATEHAGFDDTNCFVHIDALRRLLQTGSDTITEISVRLVDADARATTARQLENELNAVLGPERRPLLVYTWEEQHQGLLSAVDHQRSLMKLVLFVIMVVAAFLMYATLSMMVTEKHHDIGILTAMGATRLGVVQVFLTCGLAIVLVGTVAGVVSGCLSSIYLDDLNGFLRRTLAIDLFPTDIYNLKHVPHELDPLWIAQVVGMAVVVGLVVSGLPAWRAARYDPIESLRNE